MAVDELLLGWSAEQGGCCWRFYGWAEPTLSLGYFQESADRRRHPASRDCPAVRRLTGGGAIVHDAELTYSLVLPGGHPLAARRGRLYQTVHTGLIAALADLGVRATLFTQSDYRQRDEEPFLCFQRRAPGDVLVGRTKIAGSAQRRRRGAVLQHGSVLLRGSHAAPELPALEDVAQTCPAPEELAEAWLGKLADRLAGRWIEDPLSAAERHRAAVLVESRYTLPGWIELRRP